MDNRRLAEVLSNSSQDSTKLAHINRLIAEQSSIYTAARRFGGYGMNNFRDIIQTVKHYPSQKFVTQSIGVGDSLAELARSCFKLDKNLLSLPTENESATIKGRIYHKVHTMGTLIYRNTNIMEASQMTASI